MKFLVFNIAVVTALGFLFFGNPADIQHASDKVARAVEGIKERVFTVAETKTVRPDHVAVGSSKKTLENEPQHHVQKDNAVQKTKQDKVDALVAKVKEVLKTTPEKKTAVRKLAPDITTKPKTPVREMTPVTTTKPQPPDAEHKTELTKVVQKEDTIKVSPTPKSIIASPKIETIEKKKQTQAQKNNARIRALLVDKPRVTPKQENTVSQGLMSPQDRRRELMALADDMELVHAQSLEN